MRRHFLLPALFLVTQVGLGQSYNRIEDRVYAKRGGAAFTLDVFKSKKPNRAAVIHIISGGWYSDHKEISPAIAEMFTSQGFTEIELVHGSQPRYKVPEIALLIREAVAYTRDHAKEFGIDPNRIGIVGTSAGGHLSLLTAAMASKDQELDRSRLNAVVAFFPPTNFMDWGPYHKPAFENPILLSAFGKAWTDDTSKANSAAILKMSEEYSPLNHVTKSMPPTLLIHGDKDPLVPLSQSQMMLAKLKEVGVPTRLDVIPGKGHGWPDMKPQLQTAIDWFKTYLLAKQTAVK